MGAHVTDAYHPICYARTHAFIQRVGTPEHIPDAHKRSNFHTLVATTVFVIATGFDRVVDEREFCVLVFSMLVLFDMHPTRDTFRLELSRLIGVLSGYTLKTTKDGTTHWVDERTDESLSP